MTWRTAKPKEQRPWRIGWEKPETIKQGENFSLKSDAFFWCLNDSHHQHSNTSPNVTLVALAEEIAVACLSTYTHSHTYMHACKHAHMHARTYTHTCITRTHTHTHTHIQTQHTHAHTHTQTYTHTHMHTCTHTHTHTAVKQPQARWTDYLPWQQSWGQHAEDFCPLTVGTVPPGKDKRTPDSLLQNQVCHCICIASSWTLKPESVESSSFWASQ